MQKYSNLFFACYVLVLQYISQITCTTLSCLIATEFRDKVEIKQRQFQNNDNFKTTTISKQNNDTMFCLSFVPIFNYESELLFF